MNACVSTGARAPDGFPAATRPRAAAPPRPPPPSPARGARAGAKTQNRAPAQIPRQAARRRGADTRSGGTLREGTAPPRAHSRFFSCFYCGLRQCSAQNGGNKEDGEELEMTTKVSLQ